MSCNSRGGAVFSQCASQSSKSRCITMKFGYEDLAVWNKAIECGVDLIKAFEDISTE